MNLSFQASLFPSAVNKVAGKMGNFAHGYPSYFQDFVALGQG